MFTVVIIMALGIIVGYFLRNKSKTKSFIEKLTMVVIFALLFVLGVAIGSDKNIVSSLQTLGLQALIISLGAIFGSVLLAWWAYVAIFKKRK
ncbi:MAG TPA: LysO family transporter [Salinivirgaceae bacterium]|nr:LysO family transporter [Salinivirgaceae bacterium]HQA75680.1 LysO family transporter [Salinivirgaceae bacterium]